MKGRKYPFYYSVDGVKIPKPVIALNQRNAKRIIKMRIGNNSKIEFRQEKGQPLNYDELVVICNY